MNIKSECVKIDWQFFAESYLALAYSGIEKLKIYINLSSAEREEWHNKESGWYRAYAAKLLLIPILWNIKHALELTLKAHDICFTGSYFKKHDINKLKEKFVRIFGMEKNTSDDKIESMIGLVNKYHNMDIFRNKIADGCDPLNDCLRYPEGNANGLKLDIRAFGKASEEEIDRLLDDIRLMDLLLAIPANHKQLQKAGWQQFSDPDRRNTAPC